MKVLLVDDHAVVRMAVGMILARQGREIVGEADNGIDAVSKVLELKPDAIVLDLDIPQLDGMIVLDRLRVCGSPAKVLIHTGLKSQAFAVQRMRAGAAGFLLKQGNSMELLCVLQALAHGKSRFPSDAFNSVRHDDFAQSEAQLLSRVSRRELKVLHGLAQGLSNKQIASDMLLSNRTVSAYKTRLMQKLNVSNLLELINFASRNNLL
ncbi:two component transcriptional regulator, LuxR family [Pseudomonas sp. LAMO17WK12:I10]|uniref:response regulator transcription factor n=1 Tax=unclassified Pseudomonas TaxID=196821 RepID=UPI000BD0CE77|nr:MULTISPECIES: response regulator transcription factor [unclassified Pseudomonas]PXX54007.1 two-component system response regulator EvgA [Pseudomonas sp. LAMO17WK12:I9]SNY51946.1 two component transcriptional regulator, LuxR family [Pseudomonas sp. LAMO17WK12:I10]